MAERKNEKKFGEKCVILYLVYPSFGAEEKLSELFFEVSFVGDEVFKGGIFGLELVNIIPAQNFQATTQLTTYILNHI